jgi:ketosteroid isomerase-like protein
MQSVRQRVVRSSQLHLVIFVFIGCAALLAVAQQKSADEERVLALEKKWAESYRQRDISILSSLLAEDFVITVEDGSTFGKTGYISHSADSTVQVELAEFSDLRVRVHGNTAVVTGAYHESGSSKGKHYDYHDRLTDVWMKKDGNWQVIASHYSVPLK